MAAEEFAWKGVDKWCCKTGGLDMKVLAMELCGLCLRDATDRDGLEMRAMRSNPRLSMKIRDGEEAVDIRPMSFVSSLLSLEPVFIGKMMHA
jgi:hypothetical protein